MSGTNRMLVVKRWRSLIRFMVGPLKQLMTATQWEGLETVMDRYCIYYPTKLPSKPDHYSRKQSMIGMSENRIVHSNNRNSPFPQEQLSVPIGRTWPDDNTFAAYTDPQRSQTHAPRLDCDILFTQIINTGSTDLNLVDHFSSSNSNSVHWCFSLHAETKRSDHEVNQ